MNPVTIRIFYVNSSKVVANQLFDMCITSGGNGGKAAAIFDVMNDKFTKDQMSWIIHRSQFYSITL